jgi:hypothetical protein
MMVTDPRVGLTVSLGISLTAAVWLVSQFVFDADLAAALGMMRHAVTFLAIVVLLTALAAALVFAQFHRVRSDLLAGRNVLAEWTVDLATFTWAAAVAERQDHTEKRGALILILVFTALIFAGFAVFDPEAAPSMLGIGAALSALVIMAFLFGQRVSRIQMQLRSDRTIVGRNGLMMNSILHVWSVPLTWLVGAELAERPPATLSVTYAVLGRFGPQLHTITLPVPEQSLPLARQAARELNAARREGRWRPN